MKKSTQVASEGFEEKPIQRVLLKDLNLDARNPRFGVEKGQRGNQTDILDFIVENFGVEDVISSLAYNGYFDAEPLIAKKETDGSYTVVEGNRRLSACLILANSPRAKNQKRKGSELLQKKNLGWSEQATKVPVQVFNPGEESFKKLNAYLGVRHIMSAKAWDSYAKASWIDDVISQGDMTLEQISEVTGDKNRTIKRLLEGYYFVNQLKESGEFIPANSLRKGRGSNPEFPFSWVYTFLDYGTVRRHLGLGEFDPQNSKPIPRSKTAESAAALTYMFGDKANNRIALIEDSRQISALATAIGDPEKRELLRSGKTVAEIESLSRAPIDQFATSLAEAETAVANALKIFSEGSISRADALMMMDKSKRVAQLTANLYKSIRDMDDTEIL